MERGEELEDIQASEKGGGSRRSVEVEDRGSVKMHGKGVARELEEGEQGCVSTKKQEGNLKAQSGTLKVPVWRRKGQAKGRLNRTDSPMEIVPVQGIDVLLSFGKKKSLAFILHYINFRQIPTVRRKLRRNPDQRWRATIGATITNPALAAAEFSSRATTLAPLGNPSSNVDRRLRAYYRWTEKARPDHFRREQHQSGELQAPRVFSGNEQQPLEALIEQPSILIPSSSSPDCNIRRAAGTFLTNNSPFGPRARREAGRSFAESPEQPVLYVRLPGNSPGLVDRLQGMFVE
ncbi:SKP1-like 20 [Striga asiatica]|uniref:SKP1-like 20 n=1 Tax=Striga asiatica TaxID=4170 RepID=A0A5A7REX9_STRAF|nr:SKP1-like 20 [Striga asiatica]